MNGKGGLGGIGGPAKPGEPRVIEIEVNGNEVKMPNKETTGLEIKETAIAQGVTIQINFVLQEELANGSSKVIGDSDRIRLNKNSSFTAIAPDDNS